MTEKILIDKFNNGIELYKSSPLFKNCFEALLRDGDVYGLLEEVITMYEANCKEYSDLLINGPAPQIIVTSQDSYEIINDYVKSDVQKESLRLNKEFVENISEEKLESIMQPFDGFDVINREKIIETLEVKVDDPRERALNKKKFTEEEVIKIIIKFNQEIQEVEDVRGWFKENGYGKN